MTVQRTGDPRLQRLRTGIFFVSLPFGILMFALPLVGREMGASALEIGGLFSVFALMLVIVRPLVGHGLDRFGRRPFLIAGLLELRRWPTPATVPRLTSGVFTWRASR